MNRPRSAYRGRRLTPARRNLRRTGAAALVACATALVLAPAAPARPIFGIVPQDGALPETSDLDLMPGAGISGLRTMLHWGSIEQTRGEYDWAVPDIVIRETTNRGIQPLVFLYGTPEWAARADGRNCSGPDCTVYPPKSQGTRAAFEAFAAAAAARYGPGGEFWEAPNTPRPVEEPASGGGLIDDDDETGGCPLPILCGPDPVPPPPPVPGPSPLPTDPPCGCTTPSPIVVWQIWNEQNSKKYFAPKVNIPKYAALLKSAAAGIRSVDPAAEIMLGGMWGPNSAREVVTPTNTYLQRLYKLGAADDFDSIALHPYANNAGASIAQLRSARRVLKQAGDAGARMWVTEIGWAGRGPRDNPYVKGLAGQARVLTRALSEYKRKSRSLKLSGVFWYSWRDKAGGEAICEWCGYAGLRTRDGAEKPAWRAFVRVARP